MAGNPTTDLQKGFVALAEFEPEDYHDWMQLLITLSQTLRDGAEAMTLLTERMDVKERMDPRALHKLYMAGQTLGAAMQLVAGSSKDFWRLYQDRFEQDSNRGRTMRDESNFFGAQ